MVGTTARTVQSTLRPWGGGSGGQAKERAMVGTTARTVQSTLRPWGGGSGRQAKERAMVGTTARTIQSTLRPWYRLFDYNGGNLEGNRCSVCFVTVSLNAQRSILIQLALAKT